MVNKVLDAMTIQLGQSFGSDYHYYVENVEQGLVKPCFHISCLDLISRSKSPVLYDRTFPMVIHFFTEKNEDVIKECYRISEILSELLELLNVDGTLVRGKKISWNINDDVLQFFVTYDITTQNDTDGKVSMGEMINTSNVH